MKQGFMGKVAVGAVAATLAVSGAIADDGAYTLVTKENGSSYIQINQDLDAFSFKSDFKSIGNSGKVGYVKYSQDLSDGELSDYLKSHAGSAEFAKKINGGLVDIGAVSAGDRIGFFLERNNGDTIYESYFVAKHGKDYLEFDKNGGTGKDEWMSIEGVSAVGHVTSGGPLPGALAVFLVGGLGALMLRKRRA